MIRKSNLLFLPAFILLMAAPSSAQNQERTLVIDGATLIDGTGSEPLPNARIVIRGERIQAIGSVDQIQIPQEATIINARGKFVIPGLIDAHVHYRNWHGEMLLAYGVTTVFEIGDYTEWLLALKDGVQKGRIYAPRFFVSGNMLDFPRTQQDSFSKGASRVKAVHLYRTPVHNAEEGRQEVRNLKLQGTDLIKVTQSVTGELLRAVAEEAHKNGLPVIAHTNDARAAALAGVDGIAHLWGISATLMSPENLRAYQEGKIACPYAWMERSKIDDLVSLLVANKVYVNPLLAHEHKPMTGRAREFEQEVYQVLTNPDLSYIPLNDRVAILSLYHRVRNYSLVLGLFPPLERLSGAQVEEFQKGYANAQEFVRRFVRAGGKLFSGSSGASTNIPGLSLHHELQLLVDAGLTPMEALLSATRYPAELLRVDDQVGTLAKAKLADLVILNSDPLTNIANTKDIHAVLRGGEILDRDFHPDYAIEITDPLYLVDTPNYPVPFIAMISPKMVTEGDKTFTLQVSGDGFTPVSEVQLDGIDLKTSFVNTTLLEAHVPAHLLVSAATRPVTVTNPPPGGGVSNRFGLIVKYR